MIFYDFNASYDSGEINLVKTECDKMEQVGEKTDRCELSVQ